MTARNETPGAPPRALGGPEPVSTVPDAAERSWTCPLCGQSCATDQARIGHMLQPHYRSNRTMRASPRYSVA